MTKRSQSHAAPAPTKPERSPLGLVMKPVVADAIPDIGARITAIRKEKGITLRVLNERTGIPISTLSKIQLRQDFLSYVQLVKISRALGVELTELFTSVAIDVKTGRRSITRSGDGLAEATDEYKFEILNADLKNKRMAPALIYVKARTLEEAGGLKVHDGEEFIYVLSGSIYAHTEHFQPSLLEKGDSIYLDSTTGHAYVAAGSRPALILAVMSVPYSLG
ncbi:MAG TPA: cupin domain-containing protein [Stellaceae bacterium]|nr:cupin domain-containing protein [Stellaceae bacterium]